MNIEGLLNINLSGLRNFSLQATLVDNEQNKRVVERSKTILRNIERDQMQASSQIKVSQNSIDEAIKKLIALSRGRSAELTSRELRILSYHLSQLMDHEAEFKFALNEIDNKWKDIFFNGLVFFLMSSWTDLNPTEFESASSLLSTRLKRYSGKNKRYVFFKNHINFFEEGGPLRMCALLKARGISLDDAPSILCLNDSSFSQSYYDDVIINYFSRDNLDDLNFIEKILTKHNSTKTNKLVFANLIIDANRNGADKRQVEIGNIARKHLGDIGLPATWAPFRGASEDDITKLKRAYEIIIMWQAKQVVQTFFDVCVQDPERKKFWLKYIREISDFRIVGSSSIKASLISDARVRQQLPRIFVETSSVRNQTAALVMYIRDKVFVEFSDTGSVYIYPPRHNAVRLVRIRRYMDNINELKDTSIGKAVDQDYYYTTYNDFGLLRHAGAWQERLDRWMLRKVLTQQILPSSELEDIFSTPKKPVFKEEGKKEKTHNLNTNQPLVSSSNKSTPVQRSLFDTTEQTETKQMNSSVIASQSQSDIVLKSKQIFDGQFQIGISHNNLYIYKVSDGHIKKLYTFTLYSLQKGIIEINKPRTDGFMPIIFNQNGKYKSLGGIKLIGEVIYFRDVNYIVKRFKISEI